jgi:hypothetical protein
MGRLSADGESDVTMAGSVGDRLSQKHDAGACVRGENRGSKQGDQGQALRRIWSDGHGDYGTKKRE